MENLSAEKTVLLNMPDEDVRKIIRVFSALSKIKHTSKDGTAGRALTKLESLNGLSEVKLLIKRMIAENKMRMVAAIRGRNVEKKSNHMCFIGNPGTFKTGTAKLCAQIFHEEGIIKENKILVADRSDLVGEHCGETALKTKALIKKALGGILFIDEAYSLLEDREGSFGDEAINVIVSEIENKHDELILILAGYPEKMKHFLERNPGLESRIPNIVHFPDYDVEELYRIAVDIASQNGYYFGPDVKDKLLTIFGEASKSKGFGNGRFVRNLIERAQSYKALSIDFSKIEVLTDEDLFLLSANDFSAIPTVDEYIVEKKLGFL